VEDGTETYRDSEGKTHTRTVHSTVQVLMHYHNGRLSLTNSDSANPWAAGFNACINYSDGHGEVRFCFKAIH
jgi:hypothetical protein